MRLSVARPGAAPDPARERRRGPRFAPGELDPPVFVVGSRIVNIGLGGLMLEAPVPLAPGSRLRFHLVVSGRKAAIEGRVRSCVRRAKAGGASWGIGLEFERLPDGAASDLRCALIGGRRPRPTPPRQ